MEMSTLHHKVQPMDGLVHAASIACYAADCGAILNFVYVYRYTIMYLTPELLDQLPTPPYDCRSHSGNHH